MLIVAFNEKVMQKVPFHWETLRSLHLVLLGKFSQNKHTVSEGFSLFSRDRLLQVLVNGLMKHHF